MCKIYKIQTLLYRVEKMWAKDSCLIMSFCKTLTRCKDHFIDYVEVNVLISVFY